MSIWAKIAKYGGSALKGAGSVAIRGAKRNVEKVR